MKWLALLTASFEHHRNLTHTQNILIFLPNGDVMDSVAIASEHNRSRISKMLMRLFEHWNLSVENQLCLLGLAANNRSLLDHYRRGKPLKNDRDKLERAQILLGLHKLLRLLFPQNRNLAYSWMTTPNRAFNNRSPTKLIDEQGMMGLYIVRTYLERQLER